MSTAPVDIDPIFRDRDVRLRTLGFVPGFPIYEVDNLNRREHEVEPEPERITVEMLKRALFESSYSKPVVVPLWYRIPKDLSQPLPMVVELAQAFYEPMLLRGDERPVGCWEYPGWYLRGYLHKSPFDSSVETIRMHAFLHTQGGTEDISEYLVQLVYTPSDYNDGTPVLPGGQILPQAEKSTT